MTILGEISDKMPTTWGLLVVPIVAAAICAGLARLDRKLAWAMLSITLLFGGLFAYAGFEETFLNGPMRDAIWSELGWPWVTASIFGPLMPAASVAGVMLWGRSKCAGRGFPMDVGGR